MIINSLSPTSKSQCFSLALTGEVQQTMANFAINNSRFLAASVVYHSMIDNGNTNNLLQTVDNATNAIHLKNTMLSNSPYLSDEVVKAMVIDNTILNNDDIFEIIAANPDVACNRLLLDMLLKKTNPLDNWMVEFLRDIGDFVTDRTTIEEIYAETQYLKDADAWTMVRHFQNDTLSDSLDHSQIRYWLTQIGSTKAKIMIAEDFYSCGDKAAALAFLNSIETRNLDQLEQEELAGMIDWYNFLDDLENRNLTLYNLDGSAYSQLEQICGSKKTKKYGKAAMYASNLLKQNDPELFPFITVLPDDHSGLRTAEAQSYSIVERVRRKFEKANYPEQLVTNFELFPNPADNEITINLASESNAKEIVVYDVLGEINLMQTISSSINMKVDISELKNGTYFYSVINNNKQTIAKGKLVIIHKN